PGYRCGMARPSPQTERLVAAIELRRRARPSPARFAQSSSSTAVRRPPGRSGPPGAVVDRRRFGARPRPASLVCLNVAVAPEVVHPLTVAMLGDVTSTNEIVVPYYENLPGQPAVSVANGGGRFGVAHPHRLGVADQIHRRARL